MEQIQKRQQQPSSIVTNIAKLVDASINSKKVTADQFGKYLEEELNFTKHEVNSFLVGFSPDGFVNNDSVDYYRSLYGVIRYSSARFDKLKSLVDGEETDVAKLFDKKLIQGYVFEDELNGKDLSSQFEYGVCLVGGRCGQIILSINGIEYNKFIKNQSIQDELNYNIKVISIWLVWNHSFGNENQANVPAQDIY